MSKRTGSLPCLHNVFLYFCDILILQGNILFDFTNFNVVDFYVAVPRSQCFRDCRFQQLLTYLLNIVVDVFDLLTSVENFVGFYTVLNSHLISIFIDPLNDSSYIRGLIRGAKPIRRRLFIHEEVIAALAFYEVIKLTKIKRKSALNFLQCSFMIKQASF